jgi:hypothetical protein
MLWAGAAARPCAPIEQLGDEHRQRMGAGRSVRAPNDGPLSSYAGSLDPAARTWSIVSASSARLSVL